MWEIDEDCVQINYSHSLNTAIEEDYMEWYESERGEIDFDSYLKNSLQERKEMDECMGIPEKGYLADNLHFKEGVE